MQYLISSAQIANAVSHGHEPAYDLNPAAVINALADVDQGQTRYYTPISQAEPAEVFALQDRYRLLELVRDLMEHTAGGALVVKTSPASAHHRIVDIIILEDRVILRTPGDNFNPSQHLEFTTYRQLLQAVIAGAAR